MRLVPITAEDEELAICLECNPEMMHHIGGPRPEADVRAAHKHRLNLIHKGEAQIYKVVADDTDKTFGTIGIWKINSRRVHTYEMGWFILPKHQGKGIATEAARLIISQARSNPDVRYVHAYPAVTNAASNVIARKIGMVNQGEFDNEGFAGMLRCNKWAIDLG
jgi:RimJ/RimL family protein N-acetyltransferase